MPLLEWHEGGAIRRLAQSMAILEYLEERFPAPPLLPTDPWLRARARQLAEIVNSGIQPFQNPRSSMGEGEGASAATTRPGRAVPSTAGSPRWRKRPPGPPAASRSATRRRSPTAVWCHSSTHARRFEIDLTPYPTLTRVEAACEALPAFQAAHPDRQPDAEHGPR